MSIVESLVEEHQLIRRAALVWAIWLITITALHFMENMERVTGAAASVYIALIGLHTFVISLYQLLRARDDRRA